MTHHFTYLADDDGDDFDFGSATVGNKTATASESQTSRIPKQQTATMAMTSETLACGNTNV
jgi:hypothetical protein